MPVWRLQTSFLTDSALPRDRMVITPHFNQQIGSDPQSLCDDLCDAISAWWTVPAEVRVTAYDAQGTAPVYPAAESVNNQGVIADTDVPREVAVCLSFYSERNIPRQRGRLFIPLGVIRGSGIGFNPNVRPALVTRQKVGELAGIFSDLGSADVDWSVYSRMDDDARGVTNWWVDDEWDTIRSRGLRPTTRLTGTVGDG